MKKFLIAFTLFLVWSVIGLGLYSWIRTGSPQRDHDTQQNSEGTNQGVFEKKESPVLDENDTNELTKIRSSEEDTEINEVTNVEEYELIAYSSHGDVIFALRDGIIITKNSSELIVPDSSKELLNKIDSYLKLNRDSEIHISSLYSAYERNEIPNIGVQRGNELRDILINYGISKDRILVKSFIKPIEFSMKNTFTKSFSFQFMPLDTSRTKRIDKADLKQRTIYPKFTTTGIASNQNLKLFLTDVKRILAENEGVIVELVGHTDNVGNASDNYLLGLQYARQVKWYLINRGGISKNQIKARSKGESEPLDTNNNERGRNLNRRIEANFITTNDQRN